MFWATEKGCPGISAFLCLMLMWQTEQGRTSTGTWTQTCPHIKNQYLNSVLPIIESILILLIHQKKSWHLIVRTEESLICLANRLQNWAKGTCCWVPLYPLHSEAPAQHISFLLQHHKKTFQQPPPTKQLHLTAEEKGPPLAYAAKGHEIRWIEYSTLEGTPTRGTDIRSRLVLHSHTCSQAPDVHPPPTIRWTTSSRCGSC